MKKRVAIDTTELQNFLIKICTFVVNFFTQAKPVITIVTISLTFFFLQLEFVLHLIWICNMIIILW